MTKKTKKNPNGAGRPKGRAVGETFDENRVYNLTAAARILAVSQIRMRRLCQEGKIVCRRPERAGKGGDHRYFIGGWAIRNFIEGR